MKGEREPTKPDDNAFPIPNIPEGLTKRELFAAMAMLGFSSNQDPIQESFPEIAAISVKQADALIAALNEKRR